MGSVFAHGEGVEPLNGHDMYDGDDKDGELADDAGLAADNGGNVSDGHIVEEGHDNGHIGNVVGPEMADARKVAYVNMVKGNDDIGKHVINCALDDDDDDFIAFYMTARRRIRKLHRRTIINTFLAGSSSGAAVSVQFCAALLRNSIDTD